MNDEIKRCFQVFELDVTASAKDVKQARNEMAMIWHPDRFPNEPKLQQRGQEKLKEINAAYKIITDYLAEKEKPSFTTSNPPSDSNSRPKQPHPQPNPPAPPPRPEPSYSRPEPPHKQDLGTMLEMVCHHCKGGVQFPEEMERTTIACPNCGKELFLWRREVKQQKMRSFRLEPESATTEFDEFANKVQTNSQLAIVLGIIGFICVAFALVDFAGMFFHYDITGVSWSPMVAGFVGMYLLNLANTKWGK